MCGNTVAKEAQKYLDKYEAGEKDIDLLLEEALLPSKVAALGSDFLNFVESFYDNDGNYNETGLTNEGLRLLNKYVSKYVSTK